MHITWVRIESWHAVKDFKQGKPFGSLCGFHWDGFEYVETEKSLGIDKSCENCLRILAREADEPELEPEIEAEVEVETSQPKATIEP
jgi:hypothetical protein